MKKWLKIATIISSTALIGAGITGLSLAIYKTNTYSENEETINTDTNPNNDNVEILKFKNYFEKKIPFGEKRKIKKKITEVIKKYRLKEWNDYFADPKNDNDAIKSSVLEISGLSFEINHVDKKQVKYWKEKYNKPKDLEWTKIYKNQDEQFRYFNDFINIINEEDTKNQEDFLYLRWLYFSICAAEKYKEKVPGVGELYKIGIDDWVKAFAYAATGDVKNLVDIILAFLKYYGINISGDKFLDLDAILSFLKNPDLSSLLIDNSIVQLLIVSKDLVMRFSSKPKYEMEHYKLWQSKANRACEMYDLASKKFGLLSDSLNLTGGGSIKPPDGFKPPNDDYDFEKEFGNFSSYFKKILEEITKIVTVHLSDYCNENDL